MNSTCFKAYDIRGKVPGELDEGLAYRIGCAYAAEIKPDAVVVGHDVRLESPLLAGALIRGGHDTLASFRRRFLDELANLFV